MSFGSIGPIDQALLPANIRSGTPEQKQAYTSALGFEQMLVDQLSQELAASASPDGSTDSTDGSSSDSTSSGSLLGGSDPASSTYAQLLPTALTSSVMSAGGLGIAQQLATELDPTAFSPSSQPTSSAPPSSSTTGGSTV